MIAWLALGLVLWLYVCLAASVYVVLTSPLARAHRQTRRAMRQAQQAWPPVTSTKVQVDHEGPEE